jgi:PTS system nitrogen regulatory IIA component
MNLTVRNVCALLGVPEKTVYRWIDDGILPAYRVNDQYRFNRAELLEWASARRINVSADLFDEPERRAAPMPGLLEALEAGGIFYRVGGRDKASALRAMVEHMPVPGAVDREFLLHVLLARENLQSTGIGDGIAIPHVRNPVVLQHVARPLITLCFLAAPVDFDALDGKPVHALFSLISPSVRMHLQLLSRLSFALHDERFKRAVERQGAHDEVMAEARRVERGLRPQNAVEGRPQ